jgi:Zn-dependent M28 family amino/carboxypeptidase
MTANVGPVWRRGTTAVLTTLALVAALVACSSQQPVQRKTAPAAADYAQSIRQKVSTEALFGHLEKLQQIADANGGNRAVGSPGYDASVDYIVNTLRDKGFDVQTPQFSFRQFDAGQVSLSVSGATVPATVLQYSAGTVPAGVSGPLVAAPAGAAAGCSAADYGGLQLSGAVALVDRGSCQFWDKEQAAVQRGAVGLVVIDNVDEQQLSATLGEQNDVKIPVVSVSKGDGARLRTQPGPTTIRVDAQVKTLTARNVIAQTKTGSPQNVVMVGAHLDSVPAGPGINDNGSGVAAVLETAVQMAASPPIQNAVRFAFWGAEELGLVGSQKYVSSLDENALKDIALYLNFDMLASPNPGYFTYDGDQSNPPPPPGAGALPVPVGSSGIERTLVAYLTLAGKTAENTSFGGRSDYDCFTRAGIPSGGLFSGAEEDKSAEQARLWGGTPDAPFDPNYHRPSDTLQHIDRYALGINGDGVAYAVALYSQDVGGRNGVPVRDDRTRHVLTGS